LEMVGSGEKVSEKENIESKPVEIAHHSRPGLGEKTKKETTK